MSRHHVGILPIMLPILCNLSAFAQAPPKAYGPPIGVENAKIAAVALAEAKKNNWYMAVAVVDPSRSLVYYEKMDNTQTGSATVAP
jgi:glc operon protein GlcG